MKKFFVSLAVVCMISLLAVSAFAYNSYDNDWGCKIKQESDGSVTVSFDKEKIEASQNGWQHANMHISVYDADPGFTAESKMAQFEDNGAQGKCASSFTASARAMSARLKAPATFPTTSKTVMLSILPPAPISSSRVKPTMFSLATATEATGFGTARL